MQKNIPTHIIKNKSKKKEYSYPNSSKWVPQHTEDLDAEEICLSVTQILNNLFLFFSPVKEKRSGGN